jgi:DNA-directed RNA polymerase specialized sigma24 family protein
VKLEGLSVQDATAQLGFGAFDVKVSAHRGLKALTALISREPA